MEPRVIFEDEAICVVDKPAGMVVNNSLTSFGDTVQNWFARKFKIQKSKFKSDEEFCSKGGVVHRLDKDTSGLMVLAKTAEAYERLKAQFLTRKAKKTYLALTHGVVGEDEGIISQSVERNPKNKMKFTVGRDPARMAITQWRVVKRWPDYTLLELEPHTGRTHQIRVHLKHLGHPIVADPVYGGKMARMEDPTWCPRLFLHAKGLEVAHPSTGEVMVFEAELPEALVGVVKSLG